MISSLLALTMAMMAPSDVGSFRKAFSTCLIQYARTSAEKKMAADQFDSSIASACGSEEQAFRKAVVASDVSRGISRKTSEQGVADEVADYLSDAKERFRSALADAQTQ